MDRGTRVHKNGTTKVGTVIGHSITEDLTTVAAVPNEGHQTLLWVAWDDDQANPERCKPDTLQELDQGLLDTEVASANERPPIEVVVTYSVPRGDEGECTIRRAVEHAYENNADEVYYKRMATTVRVFSCDSCADVSLRWQEGCIVNDRAAEQTLYDKGYRYKLAAIGVEPLYMEKLSDAVKIQREDFPDGEISSLTPRVKY